MDHEEQDKQADDLRDRLGVGSPWTVTVSVLAARRDRLRHTPYGPCDNVLMVAKSSQFFFYVWVVEGGKEVVIELRRDHRMTAMCRSDPGILVHTLRRLIVDQEKRDGSLDGRTGNGVQGAA